MKKLKATPGPHTWSYSEDDRYGDGQIVSPEGDVLAIVTGSNFGVHLGGWGLNHEENSLREHKGNAALFAAAPELFEALQAALEWIDNVPSDTPLPAMPGFDRDWVDSIIGKALGEDH